MMVKLALFLVKGMVLSLSIGSEDMKNIDDDYRLMSLLKKILTEDKRQGSNTTTAPPEVRQDHATSMLHQSIKNCQWQHPAIKRKQ